MKRIDFGKIGIKWRLFTSLSAFVLATLVLLWLFQIVFLPSFYSAIKTADIKSVARSISRSIDSGGLDAVLRSASEDKDISLIIVDAEGGIRYIEENGRETVFRQISVTTIRNLMSQAEANGGIYINRYQKAALGNPSPADRGFPFDIPAGGFGASPDSIVLTEIITAADSTKLALIINARVFPVEATVQTLRIQLYIVTAALLAVALLLALIISRSVSKPIIQISKAARGLPAGKYNSEGIVRPYKEVSQLDATLRAAAGELAVTETLRHELLANISHDLRTPLTLITGYAEAIRDLPGENSPENVQIIVDEAKHLSDLVGDVMEFSKLQSGTDALNPAVFSLTAVAQSMTERLAKLTAREGYTVAFEGQGDALVYADELKITRVLNNLIHNALNFTGEDKKVTVRQIVSPGAVRIEVADTGEGIPAEKQADIWERYSKIDSYRSRNRMGTGLGLAIVKAILVLHTAGFGVKSAPGEGSVFWFEMPLYEGTDSAAV